MRGTVVGLWRYPVKSMRGEQLEAAALTARGLAGDRRYALVDRATGKVVSAKLPRLWGAMLTCDAAVVGPTDPDSVPAVCVMLPDGCSVTTGRDDVDSALSGLLGRDVTLADVPPVAPEIERYWPDIDGLALRDTETSGGIGGGAPPGTFFDYAPVHLLATTSLDRLQALYPAGQVHVRRFRPNLVIEPDGATEGFVENDWVGCTLLIGDEVRLRVTTPTPRCVVPTLPQPDVSRDVGILRAVASHNRPPIPLHEGARQPSLGVYAAVEQGGTIRHGDAVRIINME